MIIEKFYSRNFDNFTNIYVFNKSNEFFIPFIKSVLIKYSTNKLSEIKISCKIKKISRLKNFFNNKFTILTINSSINNNEHLNVIKKIEKEFEYIFSTTIQDNSSIKKTIFYLK